MTCSNVTEAPIALASLPVNWTASSMNSFPPVQTRKRLRCAHSPIATKTGGAMDLISSYMVSERQCKPVDPVFRAPTMTRSYSVFAVSAAICRTGLPVHISIFAETFWARSGWACVSSACRAPPTAQATACAALPSRCAEKISARRFRCVPDVARSRGST